MNKTSTLGNSVSFQHKSKILLCIKIIHLKNKLFPYRTHNAHSPCTQSRGKHLKFTYYLTNGTTICYLRHILESSWTEALEMVNKVIPMLFINSIVIYLTYVFIYALFYVFLCLSNIETTSKPCPFNAFQFNVKAL